MRCCQDRSVLHVCFQVPKLLQSNPTDVHDVVTLRYRCFGVATGHHRTQRCHETGQGFVEREQTDVLRQNIGDHSLGFSQVLLVRRDILGVQRRDFEKEKRYAALVASSEPLRILCEAVRVKSEDVSTTSYQATRLLKFFDLDGLKDLL